MEPLFSALSFLRYRWDARTAHGVHSPFVFELLNNVITDETPFYAFEPIESIRAGLLLNREKIEVTDFGSGGNPDSRRLLEIRHIAGKFALPSRYGQLLFRLINRFRPVKILEMGTSLGLTTLYLSMPDRSAEVVTLEGCPETARIAAGNFKRLQAGNIRQIVGEFSHTLPGALEHLGRLDFLYADGNHKYEPTVKYFHTCLPYIHENSILVFDDIHWSAGMEKAWEEIRRHERVTLSVDLFKLGILFFREGVLPQHFTLKY